MIDPQPGNLDVTWHAGWPSPKHVHTHGHGDHKAADAQFADRPNTTVVGPPLEDVISHFGLVDWPNTAGTIDLGGRVVDVIPGPGHHAAATVFYDQPDEPPLQLTVDHLRAVRAAIDTIGDRRGVHVFDDFVIHRSD